MQQIGKTHYNPPKIIHADQIYIEQRKGYKVIHFLCQCGVQGRRRYYKKSFKQLCRKCLREHNKKEKLLRRAKSWDVMKRILDVMEKGISGKRADYIIWDSLDGVG